MASDERFVFPEGFLWGAASSAHQVEGGSHNNWTQWENERGHIKDGTTSGRAVEHWGRYADDFAFLKRLHLNAYRFSIEWSRIEPQEGVFDDAALDHYSQMLDELKRLGVTPMVTLYHFTHPVWIEDGGGWLNKHTVERFERFVERVVGRLGDRVELWCTLNEPGVEAALGFLTGVFPPGHQHLGEFMRVRRNLMLAHRRAYRLIHGIYRDRSWGLVKVSFAHHMVAVEPRKSNNFFDRLAAWTYDWVNNRYYLRKAGSTMDFIGINYYFYRRIYFSWSKGLPVFAEVPLSSVVVSDLGWEIAPTGLYHVCRAVSALGKPIFITENGLADEKDDRRLLFISHHLQQLQRAIEAGMDVRGYFYWSLTDAYEWENGYRARYGLVGVDFATQKRHMRASALAYGEIARANAVGSVAGKEGV